MKLTLICLLFLWEHVEFTLGHKECSQLPTVEHAFVPSDYKKSEYLIGDVIYFSCDRGYISALTTTYICTQDGWTAATVGKCIEISCVLPVPNSKVHIFRVPAGSRITVQCVDGGRTEQVECLPSGQWGSTFPTCSTPSSCGRPPFIENGGFVLPNTPLDNNTRIEYRCESGYEMQGGPYKTCINGEWTGEITCLSPCVVGSIPDSVLVNPQNAQYLPKGQSLEFRCRDRSHVLHGQQQVTCLEERQWSHPFPVCTGPCVVGSIPDSVLVNPQNTQYLLKGQSLEFRCRDRSHVLHGQQQVTCLEERQWSHLFPVCTGPCVVGSIPDSVLVNPQNAQNLPKGQSLEFRCRDRSHVLRGQQQVTCLEERQWSHPFPVCTDHTHCGPPPALANGDFFASTSEFSNNMQVMYQCQSKYVMEGGPHKTCLNGEWVGEITCLKPCTVSSDLMQPNKITFRYTSSNKLYAGHNEHIQFSCIRGATHDGNANMRSICIDGAIVLPRCV